ncbi:MAG: Dam family site-specific DNA-(adenine-N6)-methyltransferase [Vicinamibacterales bacterium]
MPAHPSEIPLASPAARPILKWAGGKRQLLPALRPFYPASFDRFVEPFLGSGAVFLDCYNSGRLDGREVRLSDNNADIIGCYRMVRDDVEGTIAALRELEAGHTNGGAAHFYAVRDERFNRDRLAIRDHHDPSSRYTPDLAAMLIYLNRTGYNGLFRLNSRGAFNVPAGRYTAPRICDQDNLRALSRALGRPGVSLTHAGFSDALADLRPRDFVYLDPPYAPVSSTASFTAYTAGGFDSQAQERLQRAVIGLARSGVFVLLSNSYVPEVRELYARSADARAAGLAAHTVKARRAINSRASARGTVREYVVTNVRRSPSAAGGFV